MIFNALWMKNVLIRSENPDRLWSFWATFTGQGYLWIEGYRYWFLLTATKQTTTLYCGHVPFGTVWRNEYPPVCHHVNPIIDLPVADNTWFCSQPGNFSPGVRYLMLERGWGIVSNLEGTESYTVTRCCKYIYFGSMFCGTVWRNWEPAVHMTQISWLMLNLHQHQLQSQNSEWECSFELWLE